MGGAVDLSEEKVAKAAITNEIYASIKERIITMQLLPGQLLMVQHISAENGISRTPVREALVRLREEKLLEDADGRKFRVTQITWKMIRDLYEARKAIETYAVAEVAEQITCSQCNMLKKLMAEMERCYHRQDFQAYFANDMAFHDKILGFYGNEQFICWMSRVRDQQQRIRYLTIGSESRMVNSMREHQEILDRLEQHDPEGAKNAVLQHLDRAERNILKLRNQKLFVPPQMIRDG